MEETQSNSINKGAIRIGILVLALLWAVIMNNFLDNTPVSSDSGMQTVDITAQVAVAECPNIEVLGRELEIVNSILQVPDISDAVSNERTLHFDVVALDELGVRNIYEDLYINFYVTQLITSADSIAITGQDTEANFGYKFQFKLSGEFTKILFTLDDPSAPYYSNSNNLDFTKTLF